MSSKFTDIFICRRVLAIVVSLIILLLGLRGFGDLKTREYPNMHNTLVEVTTTYPGASPAMMQGFVTTLLEQAIAGSEGIDYMTSTTIQGTSTIKCYIKVGFDGNVSYTDIMANVFSQLSLLPTGSQLPVVTKLTGSAVALIYTAFTSNSMTDGQISDFLKRVVEPKLYTISGISSISILGSSDISMRIWLDARKMAAFNVTASEVQTAITDNNYQSAAGSMKGEYIKLDVHADTDRVNVKQFENMVVKTTDGALIRIKDIGHVTLGTEDYDSSVNYAGKRGVMIAVYPTPDANALDIVNNMRAMLPSLEAQYPPSLSSQIVYDSTEYIRAAIDEVVRTIFEAVVIVILVMFLFLGSLRIVTIPVVTIPLSLVGTFFLMYYLGYSINILTLLAMVLAVGLVVDDAIVVVENIYRYIEEGQDSFKAAIHGARDIATPVISMTITLVAVYAPIGFLSGVTGALFKQFAFTLAASVVISGVIALTLSPMMASVIVTRSVMEAKFVKIVDEFFHAFKERYEKALVNVMSCRPAILVVVVVVISSCFYMYAHSQSELAPEEDLGVLMVSGHAPLYANLNYDEVFTKRYNHYFSSVPEAQSYFSVNGFNDDNSRTLGFMTFVNWDKRKRTEQEIAYQLQPEVNKVAGLQTSIVPLPALPTGGSGFPIEFQVISQKGIEYMYPYTSKLVNEARKSGLFLAIMSDITYDRPELNVHIDRDKAASMGITMSQIGAVLANAMGGNYVNRFNLENRSYEVIPQVERLYRLNPRAIKNLYIQPTSGSMIPLSTLITVSTSVGASTLTHFQQMNSIEIDGVLAPGVSTGDALAYLESKSTELFPSDITYDFSGTSRTFVQEGSSLIYTFFLALVVIYLVLAAQFESFRDPIVILLAVPMSVCGAMVPIYLGYATINIYTQIGLVTLIGLISKHGILMLEFAKEMQLIEGQGFYESIVHAAATRLRPILMTTAAMVIAMVPLIFASGAGAASRFDIGLVVAVGMLVGTVFTLFVVPVMYTYIAKLHKPLLKAEDD